jgi:DNA-directed RNA polymerase specialized sigma24 family protein
MLESLKRLHRRLREQRHDRARPSLLGLDIPLRKDPVVDQLRAQELRARLEEMPEIVRETYLLRMVDAKSIAEIAAVLGVRRRAVRRHLRSAIEVLTLPTEEK